MGIAHSKQIVGKLYGAKANNLKAKEDLTETDQATKMPSIEQCETSSGSVAALPSTLELFDKFKVLSSISENGKDSDSEESFHLPLDDDDMENQSVVSNGMDKEIHNEETEDDILNKFDTVPSGTPDNIDSHIEDSILDDDNLTDKEYDSTENCFIDKQPVKEIKLFNFKIVEESTSHIEKPLDTIGSKKDKSDLQKAHETKIEVKLTYDFGEYENSDDGEFRSVYETEVVATESKSEEVGDEITKPVETVEPMEIAEESESVECISEELKAPRTSQKILQKVEVALDNFEDSMEVEQEDTNQDIANIIEKLENQDTPMEDDVESSILNDGDINMIETCDDTTPTSDKVENKVEMSDSNKNNLEKEAELVSENSEDVEMIGDSQANEERQESGKENVDQEGTNETSAVSATFQEPLEISKHSTKACSGEAQEQHIIENEEERFDNEMPSLENKVESKDHKDLKESDRKEEQDAIEGYDQSKSPEIGNVLPETKDPVSDSPIENKEPITNKEPGQQNKEGSSEFSQKNLANDVNESKSIENKVTADCDSIKAVGDVKDDIVDELLKPEIHEKNYTKNQVNQFQDDDLLKELDKTINESETSIEKDTVMENTNLDKTINVPEKVTESDKDIGNTELDASVTESEAATESDKPFKGTETEISKEPEKDLSTDVDIFKAPVEVPKISKDISAQKEEKDCPGVQNEKCNDKVDEDESDLLDISMVRETEEDDACAIADALNDNAQGSDKSDEEQSEKVETEQEGSDVDKDNDNDPIEFDDTDDDSHMEGVENDDSSNAESAKDKIVSISESSKDSVGESEPKKQKKAVTSHADASNDSVAVEVSASGEEPDKMDVSGSLVPDESLNLESTLIQDETASSATNKDAIPIVPSEDEAKIEEHEYAKTDDSTEKAKEWCEKEPVADSAPDIPQSTEDLSERKKSSFTKRTLSASDTEDTEVTAKKPKLASGVAAEAKVKKDPIEKTPVPSKKTVEQEPVKDTATANDKVKTLTGFSKFMQCRQFTAKLSRSDLEQFCIQKICESLMLKSSEGELHQAIKKHEKTIDFLRKDMQQLTKQCKDLEIVNKKLMNELRNQNALKKPLVPLKITRSVGLQVRLNPGNETPNQNRRRQTTTGTTPQKQTGNSTASTGTRVKVTTGNAQQPTAVRQVLQNSPQKSPLTTGQTTTNNTTPTSALLSQALQQPKPRQQVVAAKRTATPVRKPPETSKPSGQPGVIDLTDEDDRLAANKSVMGNTIKIINKTASPAGTQNKSLINKIVSGKPMANQGKQVGVQKTVAVGQNKGNTLSQGIRLTPTSVITSSANGSPQMVYVVPTITSNAGGTQKVAFVNFQPSNGVLSGTLNGSTVSVMSNKGQTLTLKTVPSPIRQKHPAPLPTPPRLNPDSKLKPLLPKPHLTIKKIDTGIILQWKMPYNLEQYESIASYQLYAYQETSSPPSTDMWRKVGDVKALALPMACTLTQFADKNKYYFAVRSVDVHKRIGAFSDPEEISL